MKILFLFSILLIFHYIETSDNLKSIIKLSIIRATYLGVKDYGITTRTTVLNPENDVYRFLLEDNTEKLFKIYPGDIIIEKETSPNYDTYKNEDGAYYIQNKLCENYEYYLTIKNENIIISISQITKINTQYNPIINYIPGKHTLKNFLSTAFAPVGTTLYVYGGGWDYQDIGSNNAARTIGLSENWIKFFDEQDSDYTYKDLDNKNKTYYPFGEFNEYYYAGLDCSGFVGWTTYNMMYANSLKEKGLVMGAKKMANYFGEIKKWGTFIHSVSDNQYDYEKWLQEMKVGDIISTPGHVMIFLAKCDDESFLILHSTPSYSKNKKPGGGVQMSAVNVKNSEDKDCEAYYLATEYMQKYFPKWSERYDVKVQSTETVFDFLDDKQETGIFHWDLSGSVLSDPEDYENKSAKEILDDLFSQVN